MKKTLLLALLLTSLFIFACGGEKEKASLLNVIDSKLGLMMDGGEIKEGYKFAPTDKNFLLDLEIENTGKKELLIEAVWQYREVGAFRQIVNTVRKVDPGISNLEFPFQSNIDMYRGEYLVEIYFEGELIAAHRFWVLTEAKASDPAIDIYELTKCSVKANDDLCLAEPICEPLYLDVEGREEQLEVCEPRTARTE